ncbi:MULTISPECIES: flavin monoamine oxidase family protein [Nocardioides]|uniref:Flavin monoamine oxidase family protein n=1 Tax=Nocardioides vastitatis TaxID=2568655 RepID=A0ABW0ZGS7_9ACTN|nr:FAD-dependent oxidoreductase [Nocardioides sp.]THJ16104.1 FAD-dependent oxidoreductase [Nocardioides sp.]
MGAHEPILDLGRRGLLLGGAAALGALATQALEARVNAATLQGGLPGRVDVVVVGGGISGLVAARRVAEAGRSVLVVEARDRVGGRVLNHELATGGTIEAGGAFVGPTQDHITSLAADLGIATFDQYATGKNVYVSSLTGRQEYTGTVPPDPTILLDAALALQQLNGFAADMPVDAPWEHPRAAEWDATTLGEWIGRNTVNSGGVEQLMKSWTQPTFGADPDQLSMLYVIHYVACSGNETNVGTFERNSDTVGGAQESRFVGGSQRVPLALAQRLGDRVALAAAVTRIEHLDNRAVVHTTRGRVACRRVIVSAPPKQVLGIDWSPDIPAGRRALLSRMQMGQLMKCDAVYDRPFWREDGLTGFGLSDAGAVRVAFDNGVADTDHGILLAFVGGSTWRQYGSLSRAERRQAVLAGFATMFGEKALHPIEYTEKDWTREQWTTGGPVAMYPPGVMSTHGEHIRTPFGRVHWAGTETSTYWTGYMDGAVRAGDRAAVEALEQL